MTFLPDNRSLLLEKEERVRTMDPEMGENPLYRDLSGITNSGAERGLLEIAVADDFDPDPASGP